MTVQSFAGLVRGVAELEPTERGWRPHRLPTEVRRRFPDPQLLAMEAQPSGIRVAALTAATRIELLTHPTRIAYRGADRQRGRIDVVIDGTLLVSDELTGGDVTEVDLRTGAVEQRTGNSHLTVVELPPGGERLLELWLPHNEGLELVQLQADQPLTPAPPAGPVWVHHGSSISHGSNALTATGTWPVIAARRARVELRNLGFGGSALVDNIIARTIRDTSADLISVKLGINVVNLDAMRLRSFVPAVHGFLDTIRDGHPDTQLLLISPIFCGIHENTPGPGAIDPSTLGADQVRFLATGDPAEVAAGRLTLRVIRDSLRDIVAARSDDPALHYLDGLQLFGEADAERLPLPDALHPGPEAHELIGERFARIALADNGLYPVLGTTAELR